MNSSGWMRGYMAKSYSAEDFIIHVGTTIEDQLQEWDPAYAVNIMKMRDYIFVVRKEETFYEMTLTEEEVEVLQNRSPYSLDWEIWTELEEQGIEVKRGYGNYIDYVMGRLDSKNM